MARRGVRACARALRRDCPPRRDHRVRGAARRYAPRCHARAHRGHRRHSGRARRGQGNHERKARLHRPARRHRSDGDCDSAIALERSVIADDLRAAAKRLLDLCRRHGLHVATAESCTGGLVVAALTEMAGSSDVVECGFVTYSNAAKEAMLGVPEATLKSFGAVSAETAWAMAAGALARSHADLAVAITGIAGPGGGSKQKPV